MIIIIINLLKITYNKSIFVIIYIINHKRYFTVIYAHKMGE